MPKGGKEDRMMNHIKSSEMARGIAPKEAEGIAWAHIKHPRPKKQKKVYKMADKDNDLM